MTSSNLTDVYIWSPNHYNGRVYSINKVTIHHMAGDLSVESCGHLFENPAREASSNYGVGSDGRIGMYVDEDDAPWTSASWWNDNQAITIEVADDDYGDWSPTQAAYDATIKLCADICNRYDIWPTYTGDTDGTFTEHRMFAATSCPGPWWHDRMDQVVKDVRKAMKGEYDPDDDDDKPTPKPQPSGDDIVYCVSTDPSGDEWYEKMIGHYDTSGSGDDFAGAYGDPIRWIAIDGVEDYRVYSEENGWLPWVHKYDPDDLEYGCAGDGSPIILLQIDDSNARYQVHAVGEGWLDELVGLYDTGGSGDDFAGILGCYVDAVRIEED